MKCSAASEETSEFSVWRCVNEKRNDDEWVLVEAMASEMIVTKVRSEISSNRKEIRSEHGGARAWATRFSRARPEASETQEKNRACFYFEQRKENLV